jgi:hypothetical protein
MNPSATLRGQLTERKPAPASAPSLPGSRAVETSESARCFRTSDRARGVKIDTGQALASFPYSHYLYSHLETEQSLTARFATHRVVVTGQNLEVLLDELNSQRLELLCVLPKRMKALTEKCDVWLDRIEVIEVRVAPDKQST